MLEIITIGNELLNKGTSPVKNIDQALQDYINFMFDSMYKNNGIGLAAPQVGQLKRFFIVHVKNDKPRIFINPEIIQTSHEQDLYEEGCLSVPGIYADVKRPLEVTIQAWDINGKPFRIDADDWLARVIQHEFDHLKGVLFIDRLNEKKRNRILKQYGRKK